MTGVNVEVLAAEFSVAKDDIKDLQRRIFADNGHSMEPRLATVEDKLEAREKNPASIAMWLMVMFSGLSMLATVMTYLHTAK
jgi:hypothetical protein